MKTRYCNNCHEQVFIDEEKNIQQLTIYGERFSIPSTKMSCSICKTEIFSADETGRLIEAAMDQYRQRHHLLSGEQIYSFRIQSGLTHKDLAKLLCCDEEKVFMYETNSLVSSEHNRILQQLMNNQSA